MNINEDCIMGKKNYVYFIITIFLISVFIIMYFIFDNNKIWKGEMYDEKKELYEQRVKQQKTEKEKMELRNNEILKRTPGIVCWGDGRTYGTYANGKSYPTLLRDIIEANDYPYPVVNLGVYAEDSLTVLGRSGAIPFVVSNPFTISGNSDNLIEISLTSENGEEVNPCIQDYNPGFNPCVINGIKCKIYGEPDVTNINKAKSYYLSRQDNSNSKIEVGKGSIIETSGSTEYKNYINILQIGDGGGYDTDWELVEQELKFVESLGKSKKFIIIGRIGGSEKDNEYYDSRMISEFGEHYINIRKELTGREFEGINYSEQDKEDMKKGIIPKCMKRDGYLNEVGCKILADTVYERLQELKFIEK